MDIQSSIVKAFATFLLLSYVKLLNSTVDILLSVKVYNIHQEVVGVYVYYDASYKYFGKEHHPYVIIGVGVFFRTFVLSSLLLLLYPTSCFQICLSSCTTCYTHSKKLNIYHTLLPFIMAGTFLSIMILDEAEIKAHWFIKTSVTVIVIFYTSPILVAMAYVCLTDVM